MTKVSPVTGRVTAAERNRLNMAFDSIRRRRLAAPTKEVRPHYHLCPDCAKVFACICAEGWHRGYLRCGCTLPQYGENPFGDDGPAQCYGCERVATSQEDSERFKTRWVEESDPETGPLPSDLFLALFCPECLR